MNYKPLIDAEIIIPVFTGKNSIKVETGYESAALNGEKQKWPDKFKKWGENIEIDVEVYKVNRGGTWVYFLRSDVFDVLYTDNRLDRFIQESVFGKAAFEVIKKLELKPDILHLNEAHTVVAAAQLRADDAYNNTAIVYTNHTIVPAGLEKFSPSMLNPNRMMFLIGLPGEKEGAFRSKFIRPDGVVDYCHAAYQLADVINAVSDEHAIATATLFKKLYGESANKPITGILNGSGSTWKSSELIYAEKNGSIPSKEDLHQIHEKQKKDHALAEIKKRTGIELDPKKPTVWAVRRLVEYKSQYPLLRFIVFVLCADTNKTFTKKQLWALWEKHIPDMNAQHDYNRGYNKDIRKNATSILDDLFKDKTKINGLGMQMVIGGPEYEPFWVKQFKKWTYDIPELKGRFVYAPNSDANLLKMQATGADICLTIPLPLEEACGTSDQRTALNGGVNVAIKGAGPIEWMSDFRTDPVNGNGFFLQSYTKDELGINAEVDRFYRESPVDIFNSLSAASHLFYNEPETWMQLMHRSYMASNFGANGKKSVTAKAMETRYAADVYSKAIQLRQLATRGKGSPIECLKTMVKHNFFSNNPVTIKELIDLRNFSETTVREEIKILSALGLVVYVGKLNKTKQYALCPALTNNTSAIVSELENIDTLNLYTISEEKFSQTQEKVTKILSDNIQKKIQAMPSKQRSILEQLIINNDLVRLLENFSKTGIKPSSHDILAILNSISSHKDLNIVIEQNINITDEPNEKILLICIKNKKGQITEIIRYAPNTHIDYLSSVRSDEDQKHSANILNNGHKIELLKDKSIFLGKYIKDLKAYHQLQDYINVFNSYDFPRVTEAIDQLKEKYHALKFSQDKQDNDMAEYCLKLLHTQMYSESHDIRVYANRILHDIYTDRPAEFPNSKNIRTVVHNDPQTITIPVIDGNKNARIAWAINGKKQPPIEMKKIKENGKTVFKAVIPITTGTVHYAVMVSDKNNKWDFKQQLDIASGVIKTQKDVSKTKMLEVRTSIFDLPVDENGNPIKQKDGSIKTSTFKDLENKLEDLKSEGYNALWLMDCFEWGPIVSPGKDPSSFSPLDHVSIAGSLGGEKAFESLLAKAKELDIEIVLNLIPHISRVNKTYSPEIPVYCHSPFGLVKRSSTDGLGDWDDSWQPNWRRKETLDAFLNTALHFAQKGCSFRADIGHAFDTTFAVDRSSTGIAKLFGDIASLDKMPDGSFATRDLRGTEEPNVILSTLAHQIQARAPNAVIYSENYATHTGYGSMLANDIRLIKSGTIPYDSLHKELIKALKDPDNPNVGVMIGHIAYMQSIFNRFGGQSIVSYSSHDYHRNPQEPDAIYRDVPPAQLMGDGIVPFITSILFLAEKSASLWHFARLLGDDSDTFTVRHNRSLAEFWKCWVNNIREFDFAGAARASDLFLKENPRLSHLGEYIKTIEELLSSFKSISTVKEITPHGKDCISFVREVMTKDNEQESLLFLINYGYHSKNLSRSISSLPEIEKDEIYEISCDFSYSKEDGLSNKSKVLYVTKEVLENLGINIKLRAWETVLLTIKPVKKQNHITSLLQTSLGNYKKYSKEDRVKFGFATELLVKALNNPIETESYTDFIALIEKMIKIAKIRKSSYAISTILYDISSAYPEHKMKVVDFLTKAAISDDSTIDPSSKYEIVKLLRGMHIGELVLSSLEARGITGLGGLALYIQDIAKAFISLGIDTTILTWLFSHNKEGNYIKEKIITAANLNFTGRTIDIPMDNRQNVTGYVYETILNHDQEVGGVNTLAIFAPELTDVLYGGITSQDKKDRLEFFAKSSLEAIRNANIYPSVIQGNEVTGLAFKYFSEYGYCKDDAHFARLLTTLFVGHNLERSYRNLIEGWDPIADSIHYASDAATVSPGYKSSVLERSWQIGLGDTVPAKERNKNWHAYQNGIDTVGWQKMILRNESFFTTRNKEKLFQKSKNLKANAKKTLQQKTGLTVDESAPLLTMLHRFTEQKGYEIALPAIKDILFSDPKIQVVIGGPAEYDQPLLSQIAELERLFSNRFKYLGTQGVDPQSDLYKEIYLGADVFMMPSKYEPAGLSQLEAMAAGTPVIAFDIDGLRTSVIDILFSKKHKESTGIDIPATGFKFYNPNFYDAKQDIVNTLHRFLNTYNGTDKAEIDWNDLVYNCFTYDSRWINPAKGYVNNIFAKNMGVDLEKIADFPELILIFQHPEEDPQNPDASTIENIEYTLIKYGYTSEKGVSYVIKDALDKLKEMQKMKDVHPLIKEQALKYHQKYRNYKQKKEEHFSSSKYAKEDCNNTTLFTEDLGQKLVQQKNIAVYEIRYNRKKIRDTISSEQSDSIELLITEYAQFLTTKLGEFSKVILIPSENNGDLISVTRYSDLERTKEYGKGIVDIDGSQKNQTLPAIGLLNMAFAASNIRNNVQHAQMNKTEMNILKFIQSQCQLITGIEVDLENILTFIKDLPPFRIIPLESLAEYNRIALKILSAA
ncbi:MAG: glycogen/starch synthase [Candidatus Omnitrophica bacterium]|nr:glycogen/starch synthase [Candidatus Omnitrophota bacterium]